MNQVKSTHRTIHHFGSVKYAELVDPVEENGSSKQSCTYCCCFVPKIHFLTMTQLAEVTTVQITVRHFYVTDYVCYNDISLQ